MQAQQFGLFGRFSPTAPAFADGYSVHRKKRFR